MPVADSEDPIAELAAILTPFGGPIDRADIEESAGNVIGVESILQRWRARAAAVADVGSGLRVSGVPGAKKP